MKISITLSVAEAVKIAEEHYKNDVYVEGTEVTVGIDVSARQWGTEVYRALVKGGCIIPAIILFRQANPTVSLFEAKKYVESLVPREAAA